MQYRRIHAVAGSSGAALVRMALDPPADEAIVSIEDCLAVGPLREFSSVEEWKSLRAGFWKSIFYEHGDEPGHDLLPEQGHQQEPDDERQDDDGGETRRAAEGPQRVLHVTAQIVEPHGIG